MYLDYTVLNLTNMCAALINPLKPSILLLETPCSFVRHVFYPIRVCNGSRDGRRRGRGSHSLSALTKGVKDVIKQARRSLDRSTTILKFDPYMVIFKF